MNSFLDRCNMFIPRQVNFLFCSIWLSCGCGCESVLLRSASLDGASTAHHQNYYAATIGKPDLVATIPQFLSQLKNREGHFGVSDENGVSVWMFNDSRSIASSHHMARRLSRRTGKEF